MKKTKIYLIHGWAVDTNNRVKWQPLIDQLAQAEMEAIFLPLPGLSTPIDVAWNLDNYVAWVLEQLPKKPAILLGHSFGGQVAIRLTAKYPDRVKQLVLIDSAGVRDTSWKMKLKRVGFGTLAKLGKLLTASEQARKLLYKLAGEKDYLLANPLLRKTLTQVVETDVQDEAVKIIAPTLIIWGGRDLITPLWMGKKLYRLIKNSRLEVIGSARHSPQFTHIIEVMNLIDQSVLRD